MRKQPLERIHTFNVDPLLRDFVKIPAMQGLQDRPGFTGKQELQGDTFP